MRRTNKDLSLLSVNMKPVRKTRKATPDGFNGFGKKRNNQNVNYGTYSSYVGLSGIYWIKNKINNLIYIGSSKDIGSRIIKHFSQLRTQKHPNHLLLADFNKYGQDAFEFGVYELTDCDLSDKERDYQNQFELSMLYNLQVKGSHRSDAQRLACKTSDKASHKTVEYRAKMKALKSNKIGKFDRYSGKLVEIYQNSDEACTKTNLAKSTILGACNGSKKSAGGYIWHYLDENNNILLQGKGRVRDKIDMKI